MTKRINRLLTQARDALSLACEGPCIWRPIARLIKYHQWASIAKSKGIAKLIRGPEVGKLLNIGDQTSATTEIIQKLARARNITYSVTPPSELASSTEALIDNTARQTKTDRTNRHLLIIIGLDFTDQDAWHHQIERWLTLPEGTIVAFTNSANSAIQRQTLIRFLESGSWAVETATSGIVAVIRHGSVYSGNVQDRKPTTPLLKPPPQRKSDQAEWKSPHKLERPVLTTYFTGQPDPQGKASAAPDRFELMEPWVKGIRRHNLTGIIFHDQLSDDFVKRHQSDALVFVKASTTGSRSVNDFRFLAWRDWLSINPVESVFFSDLFDVVINRDPFALLAEAASGLMLSHQSKRIGETSFFIKNFERAYGSPPNFVRGEWELNAGVWGGNYTEALRFLVLIANQLEDNARPFNSNMPAFNYTAYQLIGKENFWCKGAPLHSEFRKFQYDADVAFVHK